MQWGSSEWHRPLPPLDIRTDINIVKGLKLGEKGDKSEVTMHEDLIPFFERVLHRAARIYVIFLSLYQYSVCLLFSGHVLCFVLSCLWGGGGTLYLQ